MLNQHLDSWGSKQATCWIKLILPTSVEETLHCYHFAWLPWRTRLSRMEMNPAVGSDACVLTVSGIKNDSIQTYCLFLNLKWVAILMISEASDQIVTRRSFMVLYLCINLLYILTFISSWFAIKPLSFKSFELHFCTTWHDSTLRSVEGKALFHSLDA